MDSQLNQLPENTSLTLQGCGYRIEEERVVITIERIANDRVNDNISGTLRLQLCACSQDANHLEDIVLAETTIGEITGQHYLSNCLYDLVFQQPPVGSWQLALQLGEWNGTSYTLLDSVHFAALYQVQPITLHTEGNHEFIEQQVHPDTLEIEPLLEKSLDTSPKTPQSKNQSVKKNSAGSVDGYLAINKCKVEKLLKVKGVPKKVLEKVIAERPFHSNKAILGIKGMGPTMLNRIIEGLAR